MSNDACEAFLKVADKFKLGTLETEKPHALTERLSEEVQSDLLTAIESLKAVDCQALEALKSYVPKLAPLGSDIWDTLESGGKVYLCGCGATGRLSISLEVFCRQGLVSEEYRDRFIGFMAGGDAALIKSIENFEDFPEYGARQLLELGFGENDLLISTTEGGETPFVIGATEAAARHGSRKPWFLYCNPEEQLAKEVDRSQRVLTNPLIHSQSLYVGSMGLSGSTRMQASTVLMAAVGWAIRFGRDTEKVQEALDKFSSNWANLDLSALAPFTQLEAATYSEGEYVNYETEAFAVTVLTDTTERSPTFSLPPFENEQDPNDAPAWCYLSLPTSKNSAAAWKRVLNRPPRCLNWQGIESFAGESYLDGFYIDLSCESKRKAKTNQATQHTFVIDATEAGIVFQFREQKWEIQAAELGILEINLLLKLILNIHSTLIMGILNRFESNLMTYVKPTNFKLIDRTIRYVQRLLELRGMPPATYEEIARSLFEIKDDLSPDEAIVIRLLDTLKNRP